MRRQRGVGRRCLLQLVAGERLELCQLLLERGADIAAKISGSTVLHIAAAIDQADTIKLLLRKEPSLLNCEDDQHVTPLQVAARNGHLNNMIELVAAGASLVGGDFIEDLYEGYTLLHSALSSGQIDVVEWVVNLIPDLQDVKSANNATVAHLAALSGHLKVLKWFLMKRPEALKKKL